MYIFRWMEYSTRTERLYSRNPRKKIACQRLVNNFNILFFNIY